MQKIPNISNRVYEFKTGKVFNSHDYPNTHAEQLDSHGAVTLIFMRESETCKRNAFFNFSKTYNPGCILDLRIAPRLDVFHGSRKLSFDLFSDFGIEYYDFFGRIGVNSKNDTSEIELRFAEACIYLLSSNKFNSRPIVLFFDNEDIMNECCNHIHNLFNLHLLPAKKINMGEFKSGLLSCEPMKARG
ncbi:hypothetical protein ACI2OW_13485 [Pseudomonas shirazica]|uniref:hypothetical protein n=1 Tax=Pseudomonas TaxID=286 RepID=UPI003852EA70